MGARNYQDLIAWQKAMDLVESVYATTKQFPKEELYGLTSQVRRAAVSIPSNVAEGQGRSSRKEFCHSLAIAHGSVREVETQLMLAERLGYISSDTRRRLLDRTSEVGRLIQGLIKTLVRMQAVAR